MYRWTERLNPKAFSCMTESTPYHRKLIPSISWDYHVEKKFVMVSDEIERHLFQFQTTQNDSRDFHFILLCLNRITLFITLFAHIHSVDETSNQK